MGKFPPADLSTIWWKGILGVFETSHHFVPFSPSGEKHLPSLGGVFRQRGDLRAAPERTLRSPRRQHPWRLSSAHRRPRKPLGLRQAVLVSRSECVSEEPRGRDAPRLLQPQLKGLGRAAGQQEGEGRQKRQAETS